MNINKNSMRESKKEPLSFLYILGWYLVAVLVSVIPLTFVDYPPIIDFPIHMARIYILSGLSENPFIQEFYDTGSFFLPNMAIDVVAVFLMNIFSVESAGKIFLVIIIALTQSGVVALHYSLYRSFSIWPLIIGALLSYNWIFLFGFVNYLFGLGLMFWCLSAWIMLRGQKAWIRLLTGLIFALLLYFSHLVAFVLYGLALAVYEFGIVINQKKYLNFKELLASLTIAGLPLFIPIIIFVALSPTSQDIASVYVYQSWTSKLVYFFYTITSGNLTLDIVTLFCVIAFIVSIYVWGEIRIPKVAIWLIVSFFIAFLILPLGTKNGWHLDDRIPLALFLLIAACVSISFKNKLAGQIVLYAAVGILLVRISVISHDWQGFDQRQDQFIHAYDKIKPNSVLFVASEAEKFSRFNTYYNLLRPPVRHIVELATINRPIFVPSIYANPVLQPISLRKKYSEFFKLQTNDPIVVSNQDQLNKVILDIKNLSSKFFDTIKHSYLLIVNPNDKLIEKVLKEFEVIDQSDDFLLINIHNHNGV